MNADEIVRALRCVQEKHRNDRLLTFQTDVSAMARDAADMIESLQAENERLAIHGGRYMQLADERYKMFERAIKRADDAETQLSASQRREKAAVEDINSVRMCHTCKHFLREFGMGGIECKMPCATIRHENFEWRGPQEPEKGEIT